jgi:hypothetical protein
MTTPKAQRLQVLATALLLSIAACTIRRPRRGRKGGGRG